jgi:two-component system response regulator AtoC
VLERILIVEADDDQRETLSLLLASEGFELLLARGAKEAFRRLDALPVDVVLCNRSVAGLDGFELIQQLRRRSPDSAFILMADAEDRDIATQALERGVQDCLAKPVSRSEILLAMSRVRERTRLRSIHALLRRELERTGIERPIVAASQAMIELLESIEHIADFKSAVLLCGEPGTGKEALGRAIHAQSPRRAAPFIAVTCGEREPADLAAELYGHAGSAVGGAERARAGIFAQADRGTVYLDEIGGLPDSVQLELTRVLKHEEIRPVGANKSEMVDVRVITSTRLDLEREVAEGRFRADLLRQLAGTALDVPPLRERREDIPLLVDHLLVRCQVRLGKRVRAIADDALERLSAYPWPGNVRELENAVERAAIRTQGERITIHDLPHAILHGAEEEAALAPGGFNLRQARREFESQLIRRALRTTDGNRTHAAKLLEISHRALLYKLKEYGIKD